MQKFTNPLTKCALIGISAVFMAFVSGTLPEETRLFIAQTITKHLDVEADNGGIKLLELQVTNTGFCRFKKTYTSGKTEFYSVNLSKVNDVTYIGSIKKGNLLLNTKNDDVIVQTRNDRTGNLDTMGTCLNIPVKDLELDELNALSKNIMQAK